ncbi:TonB-dependent receptor [Syntrophorhabdus aromaticivorans]|uniref:TonB-dependent receptor n=1 Tax=Syntrophorhabdus aromaticivorans TaxID=328301 RepID=UPI00040B0125|nr:TonB-dependent receptor plug domain-containing protein [Syntrophorhabdus aromaticivorans]
MKLCVKILTSLLLSLFVVVVWARAEEPGKPEKVKEKKETKTVLEEVTVTAAPYTPPVTPVDTPYGTQYNVVTEEQIKLQNSYDFPSTLRDVPGVFFQNKNLLGSQTSHSLYIRGRGASHPSSDLAIEFDGVPRFGALFGQVLGDSIAVSTIGGMKVYKSPQPSQFGSGYALVSVLPRYMMNEGEEATLDASGGSYSTFDQRLSAGLKKGPIDVYASQSWVSTDGHRDHSDASQQSYYANMGYQISKQWNLRLLANYVKSRTEAPMPDTAPTTINGVSWPGAERYDTETFLTTLTLSHQYENFGGYIKPYWNHTDFDLIQELTNGQRYAGGTGGLHSQQQIRLYGIRGREKLNLWPGGEILVGADLDMTDLKNTQRTYSGLAVAGINGGLAKRVWDFPDTQLLSPYVAMNQTIGTKEGFHLIPSTGVRYYNHDQFEDKWAPQGGLVIGYGNTDLNINYARGVNYPTPVVLMNFVLQSSSVANASRYWRTIKPEVVDHYEAGITHTWPNRGSVGATVFRDQGKDRFRAYMYGPIPTQFNDTIGHYEIRGLELTGTVTPFKNLEFFAGATWLKAEATGSDRIERDHLPYTPGFQFQAGVNWGFLEYYRLFMDMQHVRDVYQGTSFRTGGFTISDLSHANKLSDFTLVNARVSRRLDFLPARLGDSEVFFAVNNIFDQKYEYAKGYPMPGTTYFAGMSIKFH